MELEELRQEINRINDEMTRLFGKRMDVVAEIAKCKRLEGKPVYDPKRENEIILSEAAKVKESVKPYLIEFYEKLFSLAKTYESANVLSYGLVGKTLSHSFSPEIHKSLWGADYRLIELAEDKVKDFFLKRDFIGVNVTVPYKITALECCDVLDETAKEIGCVNTVVNKNGVLYGYNTDFDGLVYCLKRNGISLENKNVLILGSGATAKTAQAAAKHFNANRIDKVSRSGELNYENVYSLADAEIIINTTPAGMYPDNDEILIDIDRFPKLCGVMDVVYNPLETRLVRAAKEKGINACGGLAMLAAQAAYSAQYFTGINPDDKIEAEIERLYKSRENIVLTGMPGSGKSLIGKTLAEKLNRIFFDIDDEIVKTAEKSIPEIFKEDGEVVFRRLEAQAVKSISKNTGCVISTGGGCILSSENELNLKQNGRIYLIKRNIDLLATEGRPLSADKKALTDMEKERMPRYIAAADSIIENNGEYECAVDLIRRDYENTCN